MATREERMEQQEKNEVLALNEGNIVEAILGMVQEANESVPVEIVRGGKVKLTFRIHPLTERQFNDCRKRFTHYKPNKKFGGMKMPIETDGAKYRSALIIEATDEEDRAKIWNNPTILQALNIVSATDVVDKILFGGEKDMIVDKINEISGYIEEDDDEDTESVEETVKN